MTRAAQGDKVQLVTVGASTPGKWRGGRGVLVISTLSGTPSLEMQLDDGIWVGVHDLNTGAVVTGGAAALMFNVELPACNVRMSTVGGAMNVWLVGV